MQSQFIAAMNQICAEKNIPRDRVEEIVKAAIATAYRKDYGNKDQEVEVEMNEGNENPTVYLIKEVVEEVVDPDIEISLEEAKEVDKNAEIGEEVKIDVTPLKYGRIAAQAAKQVVLQRVQEQEREILYEMFKNREDEILYAQVSRVDGQNVYLSIEKNTVILGYKERIPSEQYYTGKRVAVYLDKVERTTKGPQLSISRTHTGLIKKLLEKEIPEVATGEIEIRAIARDAGFRSKVAVFTENEKLDPIGSCVGQKGVRIHAVMGEVNNERVDIIQWSDEVEKFIADALQPAEVNAIIIVNDEDYKDEKGKMVKKRAAVFLSKEQRPIAIGKKGQNIRLASDLTGFEIDVYNIEELPAFKSKFEELTGEKKEAFIIKPFDIEAELKRAAEEAAAEGGESVVEEVDSSEVEGEESPATPETEAPKEEVAEDASSEVSEEDEKTSTEEEVKKEESVEESIEDVSSEASVEDEEGKEEK